MGFWQPAHPIPGYSGLRLGLSSTPVPTSDLTAQTTVYATPYLNGAISLYDGSHWRLVKESAPVSLSLSGLTADTNYDIFGYLDGGNLALESDVWSSDTARTANLDSQDGADVKDGDPTRLYLGTIRITGTTGQCEDSLANRYVYSHHNQVPRSLFEYDATNHTYSSGTTREWNGGTDAPRVRFVTGVAQIIHADFVTYGKDHAETGVQIDDTTSLRVPSYYASGATAVPKIGVAVIPITAGLGYHYLTVNERSASGTSTFYEAYLRSSLQG